MPFELLKSCPNVFRSRGIYYFVQMFPTALPQETGSSGIPFDSTRNGCREEGTFAFRVSPCFIIKSCCLKSKTRES